MKDIKDMNTGEIPPSYSDLTFENEPETDEHNYYWILMSIREKELDKVMEFLLNPELDSMAGSFKNHLDRIKKAVKEINENKNKPEYQPESYDYWTLLYLMKDDINNAIVYDDETNFLDETLLPLLTKKFRNQILEGQAELKREQEKKKQDEEKNTTPSTTPTPSVSQSLQRTTTISETR